MKHNGKRMLALLLALAMVMGFMPHAALTAHAEATLEIHANEYGYIIYVPGPGQNKEVSWIGDNGQYFAYEAGTEYHTEGNVLYIGVDKFIAYGNGNNPFFWWVWVEKSEEVHDGTIDGTESYTFYASISDEGPGCAGYDEVHLAEQKAKLLNENDYTAASWQALQNAINEVDWNMPSEEQETVNGYAAAINDAIDALVHKANYAGVNAVIGYVDGYDENRYTAASWQALQDAIDAVDWNIPSDEQATVDSYVTAINAAIGALVEKPAHVFVDSIIMNGNDVDTGLSVGLPQNTYWTEDRSEGEELYYVGTYTHDEATLDIDLYVWENDGSNLREEAQDETDNEITYGLNANGVPYAWYLDTEEDNGESYTTLTAIFEANDKYAELVFWLDGENAQNDALAMINAVSGVAKTYAQTFEMGCLSVSVADNHYIAAHDTELDTQNSQTGYFYSLDADNDVDFDTYEWKAEAGETLKDAVKEELEEYEMTLDAAVEVIVSEKTVGYYYDAEDDDYNTRTYLLQSGDMFYEFVFYMDGDNAEEIVEGIMATLTEIHTLPEKAAWNWMKVYDDPHDEWTHNNAPWTASCTATCAVCREQWTVEAGVDTDSDKTFVTHTATAAIQGKEYTDVKTEDVLYNVSFDGSTIGYTYGTHVVLKMVDNGRYNWYDNGVLAATGDSYTFVVTRDADVTTSVLQEMKPVLNLTVGERYDTNPGKNDGKQSVKLTAQWTVPAGFTFVEAGIKRAYSVNGILNNESELTTKNTSALKTANGTYNYTINMSAATAQKTVNAVAYLIYRDAAGATYTLHTDIGHSAH